MIIKGSAVSAIGRAYRQKGKAIALVPLYGSVQAWHYHLIEVAAMRPETVVIVAGADAEKYEEELIRHGATHIAVVDSNEQARAPHVRLGFDSIPQEFDHEGSIFLPDYDVLAEILKLILLIDPHDVYISETHYPLVLFLHWAVKDFYSTARIHAVQPLRDARGVSQENLLSGIDYDTLVDFTTGCLLGPQAAQEAGHCGNFMEYGDLYLGALAIPGGGFLRDSFSKHALEEGEESNEDKE